MHYTFQTLSLNLRRVHVAGFIFLCCLVRFAGFHYILSMLNYMIIYLLPVNESLIYDSLRSYNGAKKCINCVWYIEFFLLWIKSCLLKMFSLLVIALRKINISNQSYLE